MHVNKGQGITAETSGILIGGWQTDKEHAYVTVSRAREQTQIYVSREDLGEQGFDTGAMERLAEKMKRSRAQQATITKKIAERGPERQQATERPQQREHATNVDRSGDAGEQAREIQAIEHLAEHLRNEGAGEATIIKEIAKQTAGREADLERNTQAQAEHERYIDKVLQQQRQRLLDEEHRANQTKDAAHDQAQPEPSDPVPDHQPEPGRAERDLHIELAIQEERDRQQAFEQGIEQERDNDLGYAADLDMPC